MSNTESGWPLVLSAEATVPSQTTPRNGYPMHRLLPLLFLAACASPQQPSEYQRGAYVPAAPTRVAPAPVRPGVGAPRIGQPGTDPNGYPRSPYTRALPQTPETQREPGIWASDDDRPPDKKNERGPDRFVFGMGLPPIPEYDKYAIEQAVVFKCAQKIEDLFKKSGYTQRWRGFTMDEQFCLLAKLHEFCAYKSRAWKDDLDKHKVAEGWGKIFNRQIEVAEAFRVRSCVESGNTTRVRALLEQLTERWDALVGTGF